MRLRIALASAAVVAAFLPVAAEAAPPTLGATTIVTGSATAGIRVRLPRTVTLPLDRAGQVRIQGAGRAIGIVLTRADLGEPLRPTYAYARLNFCGTTPCRHKETREGPVGFNPTENGQYIHLTRGDYQLYVVADGAPVTATITLPGLKGTTRLRPAVRNRFGPHTPTLRTPSNTRGNVHGAGDLHDFKGFGGMSIQAVGLDTGPWVAGAVGDCLYDSRPAAGQVAFYPGCPNGYSAHVIDGVATTFTIHRQYYFLSYLRFVPGVLGHGAWWVAGGNVTDVGIPSFQLEFDTIR